LDELTPRTRFLLQNPGLIDAIGIQEGVSCRDLEDFRQETLTRSLEFTDNFDPEGSASLKTYSTRFVHWSAQAFLSQYSDFPALLDDVIHTEI